MPIFLPTTCPILVERDIELDMYERLLGDIGRGCVSIAVIGEAGAGKSRLVGEMIQRALGREFQMLAGGCTERDRDVPFGLFLDALRQRLLHPDTDPRVLLGVDGEWLIELLPELTHVYPNYTLDGRLTPEQRKRQCFEALASILARMAAQRPLLVVLEDLHWSDPTSLELIEFLPRRLAATAVLFVMTARSHEIDDRLSALLGTLRRARLLVEFSLDPLSDAAVLRMLTAMLPVNPASHVSQAVLSRAGGNPFFVEELLATIVLADKEWLAAEIPVPRTVRDSILRRLDNLPFDVQAIVRTLAVAGQLVDLRPLRATSNIDDDTLAAMLALLCDRGILVDTSSSRQRTVAFKHALTRDAILDGLPLSERRPLHASIADALERFAGSTDGSVASDGDLGYHFHAAGNWDKALLYARAAGDAAWTLHATFEALGHYRRALAAATMLAIPMAASLHCRCGQALDLLGGFEAARDHFEEAVRLARASGDAATEQTALYEAAGLYTSRDYQRAKALAEAALECARAIGDRQREGLTLNRLGNILTNLEQFAAGRELHEQALALFETLDDRWGMADSYDLLGMTEYLRGEVPASRAMCEQAASMFAELDTPPRVASASTIRGMYLAVLDGPCATDAPPDVFRLDAMRGLELSRSIEWRSGEAFALVALACADIGEAAYRDAAAYLDGALAIAREIGHAQWTVIARFSYGLLFADTFDDRRALAEFEQALTVARRMAFAQWETRLQTWIARCHARLGDLQVAEELLAPLLPSGVPGSIRERRALTTYAEVALLHDRPQVALAAIERLLASASTAPPAATVLLQARTLAALGHLNDASATFHHAGQLAAAYGPRAVRWQAAAGVALLTESPDDVRFVRNEIAAITAGLPPEWRVGFLAAPEVLSWVKPVHTHARAGTSVAGLTRREREVTVLVAHGLTNKEIASRLSVAEKTVEMHVSNGLGKLGFTTRVQLASWAIGQGLADPRAAQG